MSSQRDRKSGTSNRGSSTPVAVFHGAAPILVPVGESLVETAAYHKHLERLSSNFSGDDFMSVLARLERLTHPPTRRAGRKVLLERAYFAWDFAPRAEYATRFMNTTKRRLVSKNESARQEGERALTVLGRLFFTADWPRRGPRVKPRIKLPTGLKAERRHLLSELQAIDQNGPDASSRRAAVKRIIARELPIPHVRRTTIRNNSR